ncbi:MAG: glycosyltransferase [bacterium]|nr:glycosyltransferase [bacterium]
MLSIVIPTLNEEKTIKNTLESLKKLTDCNYEIIISDGKSKDKTVEIAKRCDAQTIVYNGTVRQTIGGGRNLGASIASGEFLVFLDADVTIPDINKFFKKTLSLFKENEKLVGLIVRQNVSPEVETFVDKFFFGIVNYVYLFWNNIVKFGGAGGEFQMIKTSVFRELGGFNEKLAAGEDNDLFQRLARKGETRIEMSLRILHTGRRAHKTGWSKLLFSWTINWFSVLIFNCSTSEIWKEVR